MNIAAHRPLHVLVVMIASAVLLGCESMSAVDVATSPTAAAKCQPVLAASSNLAAAGGAGAVTITTQPECAWNASSQAGWITSLSPTSGQGSGQVEFRADPNPLPSAREGEIVVNDDRVRVVQDAAPCRFEVRPWNLAISANGGTSTASVATMDGCTWRAASNVPWITLTSPAAGTGNGSITLSVAANPGGARFGDFTLAGQTLTITQDAAPVAPAGNERDDDSDDDGNDDEGEDDGEDDGEDEGGDEDDDDGGPGRGGGKGKDKDKDKDIVFEVIR
jgi:hypothetical protein